MSYPAEKADPQTLHFRTMVQPPGETDEERRLRHLRQGLYDVPPCSWLLETKTRDGDTRLRGNFWNRHAAMAVAVRLRQLPEVLSVRILRSDKLRYVGSERQATSSTPRLAWPERSFRRQQPTPRNYTMPARKRPKSPKCAFYDVADVAELFGISERTVYQWADLGHLPEPIRRPKWTRWPKAIIDEILAAQVAKMQKFKPKLHREELNHERETQDLRGRSVVSPGV